MGKQRKNRSQGSNGNAPTLKVIVASGDDDSRGHGKLWFSLIGVLGAALIGALGTIVANVFRQNQGEEPKGTPGSKTVLTATSTVSPRLQGIHVPQHIARSPFGFVSPPEIRLQIEQPGGTLTNPLVAYVGKDREKADLRPIRPSCISFEPQAANQVIYTTLNMDPAFKEMFSKAPHGAYNILLQIWSQSQGERESLKRFFNYVYSDTFTQMTFTPNDNNDFHLGANGGLLIEKHSAIGKYSSADLDQVVSTANACLILGCYKIWPTHSGSIIAFEIGLVANETANPRFTVTLGDGPPDSYAIRSADRQTPANRIINTGRSIKTGGVDNYFALKWVPFAEDDSECRLYVNDSFEKVKKDIDEDDDGRGHVRHVHKGQFKLRELAVGFCKIRLQGRGDGTILVKNLLFSEYPYFSTKTVVLQ